MGLLSPVTGVRWKTYEKIIMFWSWHRETINESCSLPQVAPRNLFDNVSHVTPFMEWSPTDRFNRKRFSHGWYPACRSTMANLIRWPRNVMICWKPKKHVIAPIKQKKKTCHKSTERWPPRLRKPQIILVKLQCVVKSIFVWKFPEIPSNSHLPSSISQQFILDPSK